MDVVRTAAAGSTAIAGLGVAALGLAGAAPGPDPGRAR